MANIEPTINFNAVNIPARNRKSDHSEVDIDFTRVFGNMSRKPDKDKPVIRKKPKHVKESHVKPELDKD